MTFTVSTFDIASEYIGADEAIPAGAFDFKFDDEGCLVSYWVTVNKVTGSKELVYTAKGVAALNAFMDNADFIETKSNGCNAEGGLATDYAISDYNTWK
jgi:hypothetical protein